MFRLGFWCFLLLCSMHCVRLEEASALTEEKLANKINAFGCNLLGALYKEAAPTDNVLISPVNTYAALAQLHLGAAGKTRDDLATVMKLFNSTKNPTEVHELLKAVVAKLIANPENPMGKFHETVLANGVFLGNEFLIKDSYLESLKKYYNGVAQNVDFSKHAQESTDVINNWISNATKGRIPKFYEEPLSDDTICVLTSALYFNAKWKNVFVPEDTKAEKFHQTSTTEFETQMMNKHATLEYENDDTLHYESVTLPYAGGQHEMTIYLQHQQHGDHGSLAELYHALAQKDFDTSKRSLRQVNLKLPKMKFSWKKSVVGALALQDVFGAPDLSEMTALKNVKISNMIHATELEVDEEGTVASAATAIEMILFSAMIPASTEPVNFYVDRPFLLTITHTPTRAILFSGIVRKPM